MITEKRVNPSMVDMEIFIVEKRGYD